MRARNQPGAAESGRTVPKVSRSVKRLRTVAVASVLTLAAVAACGTPQSRPRSEDRVRRVAPLPACVMRIPPRRANSVAARALAEDQYWKLIFPDFDLSAHHLADRTLACTGENVLDDPRLAGGTATRGGWPLEVQEGDITYGSGGDRLKVIWLRSHRFADGTVGGALALTRVLEDVAEVYSVGVYRGVPDKTKFGVERLGGEILVTAQDEGCLNHGPNDPCETRLSLFLPRRGGLHDIAEVPLERVAFATGTEPGVVGRIEYHLTTSPKYIPTGLKLLEQVQVKDDHGRVLRKAELERLYAVDAEKPMQQSDLPLWPRIYPGASGSASASAVAAAPAPSASAK